MHASIMHTIDSADVISNTMRLSSMLLIYSLKVNKNKIMTL